MPSFSTSEQIVSKHWTILQQIPLLLFFEVVVVNTWCCDFKELLWLFCSSARNIVQRISLHDLPYRKTKKLFFAGSLRKSLIQTCLCNCLPYLCLLGIIFEYIPNKHGQEMMFVRPYRRLSYALSALDRCFLSFLSVLYRPRTQTIIFFCHGLQISIPNLGPSPNHVPIELSRIAFPIIVLPKDDRTGFAQEERLGLPYWAMIFAICALVYVSKYLDILTSEF